VLLPISSIVPHCASIYFELSKLDGTLCLYDDIISLNSFGEVIHVLASPAMFP
jgi:hypothetical protein